MHPLRASQIYRFSHDCKELVCGKAAGLPVSANPGHAVSSYQELLAKVAALNFYNSVLKLFFRGQKEDYLNYTSDGKPVRSNLYPSILRFLPIDKKKRTELIKERINKLQYADSLFLGKAGTGYIHRHMLVRWAILQHYEVCATPLLDLTDSLQIALTFALSDGASDGYLYVFGLPHQTSPISVSIESMVQVVDLSKICPLEVSRPHFQSAFLAADYPTAVYAEELILRAPRVEANFACRLLTKFRLDGLNRWRDQGFVPVSQDILFPNQRDQWYALLSGIRKLVAQKPGTAHPTGTPDAPR